MSGASEIDIRADLVGRHAAALRALHRLTIRIPRDRWVIVGGMMVQILARRYGTRAFRAEPTKDADNVVDVVTHAGLLDAGTLAVRLNDDGDPAWSGVAPTDRTLVRATHALLCARARDND
jgi:hypothetical protein